MQSRYFTSVHWIALGLLGCSSSGANNPTAEGTGGSYPNGSLTGKATAGGATSNATGGASVGIGGTSAVGGNVAGGMHSTGGSAATGGQSTGAGGAIGGKSGLGGNSSTGGTSATNSSVPRTGGTSATTSVSSTGGVTSAGGTSAVGGGTASSGGTNNIGGGVSTVGGASTAGGTSNVAGSSTGGSSTTVLNGCTATISEATLNSEYQKWKDAYVKSCSSTVSRVQAGGSAPGSESSETFSEGIGYGMLLAVSFNDQSTFDKLWAYYKAARNTNGLMNWKMNACTGNYYDANGASDGDLDTAMALVMGDRRWGGYTTDTNDLINAIREFETMPCSGMTLLRPGDAWGLECTTDRLNPSYFSPAYYRAFALYQPSEANFWNKFADDSIELLLAYQASTSSGALMGEWSSMTKLSDQNYDYNACRTPWRVAMDYVWWGTEGAKTYLTRVSAYVDSKGGVAGVPFAKNSAFLAPFALSGIASNKCDPYYQSWMTGAEYDDRYFQGTLRVLAMLVMAGKFTP